MALILKDRVKETTTTTGTGSLTLAGAVTGYQSFSSAIGNGNTTYYAIYLDGGSEWEVGLGTYVSAGNSIARSTILSSSTGGTVNFSAGTKNIFITYAATRALSVQQMSSAGSLLSRDGSSNVYDIPIGSTGQVLTVAAGYPSWQTAAVGTTYSS